MSNWRLLCALIPLDAKIVVSVLTYHKVAAQTTNHHLIGTRAAILFRNEQLRNFSKYSKYYFIPNTPLLLDFYS